MGGRVGRARIEGIDFGDTLVRCLRFKHGRIDQNIALSDCGALHGAKEAALRDAAVLVTDTSKRKVGKN